MPRSGAGVFDALLMSVELTLAKGAVIALAGCGAGFINAIVGSGTLISFPTLVSVGFDRLPANIANNIGLVPGSASAVYGYRRELAGQRARLTRLVPASLLGGLIGALLLLVLPASYFKAIVPFLVLLGCVLVSIQPMVQRRVRERRGADHVPGPEHISLPVLLAVYGTGVYGGYFGAGQGVVLMGILGLVLHDDLQRINGTKNVLAGSVNAIATFVFIIRGNVEWTPALIIAVASVIGAQLGASVGRRIPATGLRVLIVCIGLVAASRLLFFS